MSSKRVSADQKLAYIIEALKRSWTDANTRLRDGRRFVAVSSRELSNLIWSASGVSIAPQLLNQLGRTGDIAYGPIDLDGRKLSYARATWYLVESKPAGDRVVADRQSGERRGRNKTGGNEAI